MSNRVLGFAGGFLLFLIQPSFADEILRGVVVENNMENPEIGSYLHVVEENTGNRFFVVYMPSGDNDDECFAKVKGYWIAPGDTIEVHGDVLKDTKSGRTQERILTTCDKDSYIHSKRNHVVDK